MAVDALLSIPLRHLVTGLHEHSPRDVLALCGRATDWAGYTEWVSDCAPRVSLGWDWSLRCPDDVPLFVRASPPKTNVMLLDEDGLDMDWARNTDVLATVVQSLDWEHWIDRALAARYPWTASRKEHA